MLLVLGDAKGLDLPLDLPAPEAKPSRWAKMIDVMLARVPDAAPLEPYDVTEQRKFLTFAQRMDAHADIEDEYLAEVARLTGTPVSDWLEADTALEKFVLSAGPEHDDALIRLFYRWALAQAKILLPGLAELPMFGTHWPRLSRLIA
jgi:hypothetical protein